jgi:hypothetical protein
MPSNKLNGTNVEPLASPVLANQAGAALVDNRIHVHHKSEAQYPSTTRMVLDGLVTLILSRTKTGILVEADRIERPTVQIHSKITDQLDAASLQRQILAAVSTTDADL